MADGSSKAKNAWQGEISIDLLAILNRRKGLLLASSVFGLLAGVAYLFLTPPTYESTAQVLLMQNDSASMASEVSAAGMSVSEELLATHMSLIQSRRLVGDALSRPVFEFDEQTSVGRMQERSEGNSVNSGAGEVLADLPSISAQLGEGATALSYVVKNLYVTRGGEGAARDARILSIAFRHVDENDSRLVVAALLNEYRDFVKSKFQDINKEALELIGNAREEIKEGIGVATAQYASFRDDSPILGGAGAGANVHTIRYEELASEISQLDSEIDSANARIQLVAEGLLRLADSSGPELEKLALIDERNVERLGVLVTVERGEAQTAAFQAAQPERIAGAQTEYNALLNLRSQLAQARQDFGPRHPEVQTLENQVTEMETFFVSRQSKLGRAGDDSPLTPNDVMTAYQSLLKNDLLALEHRRADLQKQLSLTQTRAKELVQMELEDERLLREIARQEDLYSSVIERLRDLNMQEDSSALIQEVIAEPEVGKKVSPNGTIAVAIAALSTMILACASVLLAELSDKSIRSSEDLEAIYKAPILGHIPNFEKDAETKLLLKKVRKSGDVLAPELIVHHDPKSRISELYRTLRAQLLFDVAEGKNVIAVTSPEPSEGKSTSISNIAISLASTGKSVLLVDCDLRRPSVHSLFGLEMSPGLTDVVEQAAEVSDALHAVQVKGLSVLTSGGIPNNPAEILSRDSFSQFIAHVREKFDFVLVDCPPVLPVSDPCVIARLADHVLVVTTITKEGEPKANQCRRSLESVGKTVSGLVVNRANNSAGFYSYSGYEYGYREHGVEIGS